MNDVAVARAIHVLAVVLWIGGVGFVTTIVLPVARRIKPLDERFAFFEAFEHRFSWQARTATLLAGLSGLYMLARLDLWDRFRSAGFWWMHAMVLVWLVFTLMLFVIEPFFLGRWLHARARIAPDPTFRLLEWVHRVLFALSILTILGAVAGSHGFYPF